VFIGACSLTTDLGGFTGGPVDAALGDAAPDSPLVAPADAGVEAALDADLGAYAREVLADRPVAY
jgi:hypothetical protein